VFITLLYSNVTCIDTMVLHSKKQHRSEGTFKVRQLLTSALNEGPTLRRVGYITIVFLLIYSTLLYMGREEKPAEDTIPAAVHEAAKPDSRMAKTNRLSTPARNEIRQAQRQLPAKKPLQHAPEVKQKAVAAISKTISKIKSDRVQQVLKPEQPPVKQIIADNNKTLAAASKPDPKVQSVPTREVLNPKKTPVMAAALPLGKPERNRKEPVAEVMSSLASFIKLGNTGKELAVTEPDWVCVKDTGNGLVWENKTSNGGLQDMNHSFSWYQSRPDPNSPLATLISGVANGGRCAGGIACDTQSYVRVMNARKLCGYSDWRLPTREEMLTLVKFSNDKESASIDNQFFPNTVPSWYWTASDNKQQSEYAWYVLFRNGIPLNDLKKRPKHIRLVRGKKNNDETGREFARR